MGCEYAFSSQLSLTANGMVRRLWLHSVSHFNKRISINWLSGDRRYNGIHRRSLRRTEDITGWTGLLVLRQTPVAQFFRVVPPTLLQYMPLEDNGGHLCYYYYYLFRTLGTIKHSNIPSDAVVTCEIKHWNDFRIISAAEIISATLNMLKDIHELQ